MSATVALQEAQSQLKEIIDQLGLGEEVIITENHQPVARLLRVHPTPERRLGSMSGSVKYAAPDFDAPLDDFKEYMQ